MQEPVDKEKKEVCVGRKLVGGGLFSGDWRADKYLAALGSGRVGKHIRDIILPAQGRIQFLGARFADEYK